MSEAIDQKSSFQSQRTWRENNPQKVWAQRALRSAVKIGIIEPKPCRICGEEPTEARHPDYDQPMDVGWYCRRHHKAEHARLKCQEAI